MSQSELLGMRIGVIIPSYRVTSHILGVIARIGPEVASIYVIDDKCPDGSGDFVEQNNRDPRVKIIRNQTNMGVGGAVMAGYREGLKDGAEILVKLDGDGQMDGALIPQLIAPIIAGEADYTKGNRFYAPEALEGMPFVRVVGNAGLSFLTKLSSGYWDMLDPTNGFTAIHAKVADTLPFEKIAKRYFFESDLLFRLGTVRAVVADIPMHAFYDDEESHLNVSTALFTFGWRNIANTWKRILYSYFLRGFSFASFCLIFGVLLIVFGAAFGSVSWATFNMAGRATPTGTVMIAVLPLMIGFQLLLSFFAADIASTPTRPIHRSLLSRPKKAIRPFINVSRDKKVKAK